MVQKAIQLAFSVEENEYKKEILGSSALLSLSQLQKMDMKRQSKKITINI